MSNNKATQLLFHRSQLQEAEQLQNDLQDLPLSFEPVQVNEKSEWNDELDDTRPLIWIVSDNYLKSTAAMRGALAVLQSRQTRPGSLFVVVTPGLYPNEEGEGVREVPTRFDRMGEVIQYMNYWQTEYLDMRKWKRNLPDEDQTAFEEKLKGVKAVSSNIGDFLRILRDAPQAELHHLQKDNYAPLLRFFGFKSEELSKATESEIDSGANSELRKLMESSSDEILRENQKPPEESPVPVEDIPGMDLLSRASNALNEIEEDLDLGDPEDALDDDIPREAENKPEAEAESDKPEQENPPIDSGLRDADKEEAAPDEEETAEEQAPPWETKLEEAEAHLQAGNTDKGISMLENLVNRYPAAVEPRFQLAVAALRHMDDARLCRQLLEDIIAVEEDHLASRYVLGELALQRQDFGIARDYLESVYEADDEYPEVRYRLGMLYAHHFQDEPGLAEHYLKKAIKQQPDLTEGHYQLGVLYQERLFRPKKAKKHFKKTLKHDPEHPFANYDLALLYHQAGKLKKARKYYLEAVARNPELRTPENDEAFRLEETTEPVKAAEPQQERELQGDPPVVLITGATSGIGRATARLFAQAGYRLILTGRRADRLYDLKQELLAGSDLDTFRLFPFDVRDPEAVENMLQELEGRWRNIDILINNAGLAMGLAPVHEGDLRHWDTMIDTNIKGLLYMTRAVTPGMVKRGEGMVINVCSTAGKETYPNGNVYAATKHAVDALTKSFRLDLYQHGIRVGQVSPGHVEETEFALVRFEGDQDRAQIYQDFVPLRSTDVAEAIYFMATRPPHVNVQDILLMGTQQAGSNFIDRSGRE